MSKGLIPLMLSSPDESTASFGPRASVVFSPDHRPNQPTHIRRISFSPPVSPGHKRNLSDATHSAKFSRPPVRPAAVRRQSQQVPASLPVIPYSSAEWKKAITEIKRYHVTRRFRACSARCSEILTNIKNPSVVEPAYLIYLNFYAATSLEMCARSLAPASAYRISLLQQARAHYERAAALIQKAEENAFLQSRSSSAASSLPSLHSPSNSVSSRAWTPECGLTTPTSAISRKSSLALEPRSRHSKKKVSFELPKDKSQWSFALPEPVVIPEPAAIREPMIRPDSPTLGFDDDYFTAGAMRQELPEIPTTKRASRQECEVIAMPTPSPPSMPSISECEELTQSSSSTDSPSTEASGEEYPFFRHHDNADDPESARSIARYCETLSSLKTQVASHMRALQTTLEGDLQQQEHPDSPTLHDGPASLMAASLNRMSLGGGGGGGGGGSPARSRSGSTVSFPRSGSSMSFASSADGEGEGEVDEERSRDRRARIDKLRMNGWKRKRFDQSRYQELCDTVMEELNHA